MVNLFVHKKSLATKETNHLSPPKTFPFFENWKHNLNKIRQFLNID